MSLKKLSPAGFAHQIVVLVFAVAFAIAGVAYLVVSHANPAPYQPATLQIDAGWFSNYKYDGNSPSGLEVVGLNTNSAWCNNTHVFDSTTQAITGATNLGVVRTVNCTPGNYKFWLVGNGYVCRNNPSHNGHIFYNYASRSAPNNYLHAGGNGTIYLCSYLSA